MRALGTSTVSVPGGDPRISLPCPRLPAYQCRLRGLVGAERCLRGEGASRVADQYPSQGHGEQARAVPNRRRGRHLHGTLPFAVPVGRLEGRPVGVGSSATVPKGPTSRRTTNTSSMRSRSSSTADPVRPSDTAPRLIHWRPPLRLPLSPPLRPADDERPGDLRRAGGRGARGRQAHAVQVSAGGSGERPWGALRW